MKKYDSYKDSGIEWIGEIPEHWSYSRLKLNSISKTGTTPSRDNNEYWDNGTVPWMSSGEINQRLISNIKSFVTEKAYKETSLTLFPKGSLVIAMNGQGKTKGMVGVLNIDTSFNQSLTAFQFNEKVNSRYVYYFLDSKYNELRGLVGEDREGLSSALLKNIYHPLPKFEEQTIIANYLDNKTTQIDNLIAKKEQFITLLQEERTAVINQAVTKGLDPNVPMKDSGIEWLGEIPEHWESWKISHAFNRIGSGTTPESGNPVYHENGTINWLNTGDLNDGVLESCGKKITEKALEDYSSLKLFPAGSLVMAMYGATIGKTSIINFETTTNQACCVFCKSEIIDVNFLQYWFIGKKEHIINLAIGGGQPNISQNILKDIRVYCPKILEQREIVNFISIKTNEIDSIISKAFQEIELLKEYKTALISEVVTGKVDVREEVLN